MHVYHSSIISPHSFPINIVTVFLDSIKYFFAIKKSPQTFVYEDPLKESSERGI